MKKCLILLLLCSLRLTWMCSNTGPESSSTTKSPLLEPFDKIPKESDYGSPESDEEIFATTEEESLLTTTVKIKSTTEESVAETYYY